MSKHAERDVPAMYAILAIIREAGNDVKAMQSEATITGVKPDFSIITNADEASHLLITEKLRQLTPDIPVLSEEQPEAENHQIIGTSSMYWVIDPLDNTANYINKGDSYSINIALIHKGIPVRGVLYFPCLNELYFTGDDTNAYKQTGDGVPAIIAVAPLDLSTATIAVAPDRAATHIPQSVRALKLVFTRGQGRACLVASGVATFCSERAGFCIWDSAAAFAIVEAAGGKMVTQEGGALFPNTAKNALHLPAYFVGHPEIIEHLQPVNNYEPINNVSGGHA